MTAEYTKGEWKFQDWGSAGIDIMVSEPDGERRRIAELYGADALSNAHLIIAASQLLQACEAAYDQLTHIHDGGYGQHKDNPLPMMLRNAIAKAKGAVDADED